ncbi:hypothetical protein D8674_013822 [Pyrus ussuriensis x Pyrus communis]|uniref:Uncharacterized protein n=1 Tax=Pyrus ussuriensis x Pyrus communis TaxID=2448454 RepID=A0A5N5GTF6_9ROSA|nr:hypothetical protein D8674_013822 [Pyrus ussuriensis x Pyrus communis]
MAFKISKAQQHQPSSFSEAASGKIKDGHEVSPESQSSITSHVYLKSPAAASLDRDVVLRRIRHHKHLSKVKSAFQAFMGSSSSSSPEPATSPRTSTSNIHHETWLHQEDSFSSP